MKKNNSAVNVLTLWLSVCISYPNLDHSILFSEVFHAGKAAYLSILAQFGGEGDGMCTIGEPLEKAWVFERLHLNL